MFSSSVVYIRILMKGPHFGLIMIANFFWLVLSLFDFMNWTYMIFSYLHHCLLLFKIDIGSHIKIGFKAQPYLVYKSHIVKKSLITDNNTEAVGSNRLLGHSILPINLFHINFNLISFSTALYKVIKRRLSIITQLGSLRTFISHNSTLFGVVGLSHDKD